MKMRRNQRRAMLASLIAVEVVAAVLAWRDLRGRSDDEIRGRRRAWRVLIIANPGNSIPYWLFGRKVRFDDIEA